MYLYRVCYEILYVVEVMRYVCSVESPLENTWSYSARRKRTKRTKIRRNTIKE